MPQTMEEHLDELEDAASMADMSISSFSENQVSLEHSIWPVITMSSCYSCIVCIL